MFLPFFHGPTASRTCNPRLIPPVETRSPPIWDGKGNHIGAKGITLSVNSQSMCGYVKIKNQFD